MSLDRLDWDNLRVFKVVSELGSMSAAAARLGESPPTISRKLDDLEKSLNLILFNRTTRGVTLTEAGKRTLRHVLGMWDRASVIVDEAEKNSVSNIKGAIKISAGDGVGPYWIAPELVNLQKAHPGLHMRLDVVSKPADLPGGEADISIQFVEPKHAELISHKLATVHYMSFASEKYLETHDEPNSLFEYYKHRCILHENYVHQIERWIPKMPEMRKTIDFALVTNSGPAMVNACLAGGGIAILPSYMAIKDDRLVPLDLPEVAPLELWLCYTERVRRLPEGKIVLDWIRSLFNPEKHIWFREEFEHPGRLRNRDQF